MINVNSNRTLFADKYISLSNIDLYNRGAWLFGEDIQSAGQNKLVITVTSLSGFGETQGLTVFGAAGKANFSKLQLFRITDDGVLKAEKIDKKGTYVVWLNNIGYWNISNSTKIEGSFVSMDCVVKYDTEQMALFEMNDSLNNIVSTLSDNRDIYSGVADLSTISNFIRVENDNKKYQSAVLYLKHNNTSNEKSKLSITCLSKSLPIVGYDSKGNIFEKINYLTFDDSDANILYFNIAGLDSFYLRNNTAINGETLEYNLVLCSESIDHLSRIKPNQKICEFCASATGAEKSFGGYGDFDFLSSFFKYFKVYVAITDKDGNAYKSNFSLTSYDYYRANNAVKALYNGTLETAENSDVLTTDLIETGADGKRFYVVFGENPPAGTLIRACVYGVR